jgi:hypothetical protein
MTQEKLLFFYSKLFDQFQDLLGSSVKVGLVDEAFLTAMSTLAAGSSKSV